jgi:hypothetical protein
MDARTIAFLVALAPAIATADDYVGSTACASCHGKLYEDYRKTAMGRAASQAAEHVGLAPEKVTISSEKLQRTFEVYVEKGQLHQSESGTDFRSTHALSFALGSGVNGLSFLVRRGDHLFQAPLSYYSRAKSWGLSPGYEFADHGFNRPIAAACIACHSGRPKPVPGRNGQYGEPPFLELSIGCESCHGPGLEHVRRGGAKAAIVNPARLPAARSEEICMNCHQGGDTRVLQPGKTALDFRPGQVLNDTVAIFKIPRNASQTADVDLLEHHESMHLSKCFRESAGKLKCISCHSPHAARPDYRAACLGCHKTQLAAPHPPRSSDCQGCHMPKRNVGFIAHSALTNHRIVRTPGQALPAAAFAQTTPELPDLVHFNRAGGKQLPLTTQLQAYGELLERHPPYFERFQAVLDEAAQKIPEQPLVLAALGRRALRSKAYAEAIQYLNKAVARGSESSTTFEDLGEALAQSGRLEESVAALRRGIELAPYTPVLHKSLALRYIQWKKFDEARKSLERYVELFPEDDFVRRLLKQVSGNR